MRISWPKTMATKISHMFRNTEALPPLIQEIFLKTIFLVLPLGIFGRLGHSGSPFTTIEATSGIRHPHIMVPMILLIDFLAGHDGKDTLVLA